MRFYQILLELIIYHAISFKFAKNKRKTVDFNGKVVNVTLHLYYSRVSLM